jgi:nucleotide-binding universal stress UspA family protein
MSTSSAAKRIVVGVDGSGSSVGALRWAADEARRRGAGLHVVTCWTQPVVLSPTSLATIPATGLERDARELAEKEIANVLGESTEDLDVSVEVIEGPAALRLLEFGNVAEMIVVGSRGRGGFAGLLLGSASQHLAEHAPCPVVIIHSNEA